MSGYCEDERITAFGLLLETNAALTASVGRDLEAETGLPLTWLEVLLRLARVPEGHLRMSDLAAEIVLSTSGLTRVIDRMEVAGLVKRQACPKDRRVFHAVLTDEGKATLEGALPSHAASIERHLVDPLGIENLASLTEALRTLRDSSAQRDERDKPELAAS